MDTWAQIIFSLLSLVLILGLLIYGSRWVIKKNNITMKSKHIKIVDRVMLGQDKSIVVADIFNKLYILGISGQQITLLKELNDVELTEDDKKAPDDFSTIFAESMKTQFSQLKSRFGKRGDDR